MRTLKRPAGRPPVMEHPIRVYQLTDGEVIMVAANGRVQTCTSEGVVRYGAELGVRELMLEEIPVDEVVELRNVDAQNGRWFRCRIGSWFSVLVLTAENSGSVFQASTSAAQRVRFASSGCQYEWRRVGPGLQHR